METTRYFQTCLLYLMVNDLAFLKQTRHVLEEDLFVTEENRLVARLALQHFDEYAVPLGAFVSQELAKELERGHIDHERIALVVRKLNDLNPESVNVDYIRNSLSEYVQERLMQEGAVEFAKLVSGNKFSEAKLYMRRILDTSIEDVDDGVDYLNDLSGVVSRGRIDPYWLTTGIRSLDKIIGGFRRPQFVTIFGGYKGGKSWAMTHIGRVALLNGCKVLHITHELTKEEVEERYDMSFGALVSGGEPEEVELSTFDGSDYKQETIRRPCTRNFDVVKKVRRKMRKFGGQLRIVKFPMGQCKTLDVESLMARLESKYDFVPDVIINDYADIMYAKRENLREDLNQLYIWHKSVSDRWGALVVTGSQVTRGSLGRMLDERDFAEDIRKAANVDLGISLCKAEKEDELIVHVALNRNGPQKVCVRVGTKFQIGQFCRWSQIMGRSDVVHD